MNKLLENDFQLYYCLRGFALAKLAEEKIKTIKNDKNEFPKNVSAGFDLYNKVSTFIYNEETLTKECFEERFKMNILKIYNSLFHLYVHEYNLLTIKSSHLFLPNYKINFEFLDINKRNYGRKKTTYLNSLYANLYYKYKDKIYQIIKVEYINLKTLKVQIENENGNAKEIKVDIEEFRNKDFYIKKEDV